MIITQLFKKRKSEYISLFSSNRKEVYGEKKEKNHRGKN